MTSRICHLGGLSSKAQEDTLRGRPDILIATPGRLIDHLQTTSSFSLQALDVLILDEADRMRRNHSFLSLIRRRRLERKADDALLRYNLR